MSPWTTRKQPFASGGASLNTYTFWKPSPFGPTYPRGAKGALREIVFCSYRIFYDVSEPSHRVEILHVWHPRLDEPKLPTG